MRGGGLLGAVLVVGLGAPAARPQDRVEPADLVLRGGRIWTGDPARPWATSLASAGEFLLAVGDEAAVAPHVTQKTRVIELKGAFVTPGINDAHCHVLGGGRTLLTLDLMGVRSLDEVLERVKAEAAKRPAGSVIRGRGWDHTLWPGPERWPTAADLDRVAPEHMVALTRVDGHVAWANSLALRASGIGPETRAPPGGAIERDPATRAPTGILKETAGALLRLPDEKGPSADTSIVAALDHARKLGVTSLQDGYGDPEAYARLRAAGMLTARASVWLPLDGDLGKSGVARRRLPDEDPWIRVATLKGFVDGTMGSGTAAFFEGYADNPDSAGLARLSGEKLNDLVLVADRQGWQVALHAIGDRAVAMSLDAFAAARLLNRRRDTRHRVEHAQVVRPQDIPRFAEVGAIASMQPCHVITDSRWAAKRVGRARLAAGGYAWKSFLRAGVPLAFGTDWPVEPLDPGRNLFAAVARRNTDMEPVGGWFPDEAVTAEEALRAMTAGAAYAEFQEGRKGILKAGFFADVAVWDRDLTAGPPEGLLRARATHTIVGGRVVWDRAKEEPLPVAARTPDASETCPALAGVPGVTGTEERVRAAIVARLPDWARPHVDPVGNLIVEFGAGDSTLLVLTHMDEIGWRVTGITDEGYLRLSRPGHTAGTPEADRLIEGKQVVVEGDLGPLVGAVTASSTHLRGERPKVFDLSHVFVDVGARSAAEAREMGGVELSPVAWRRFVRPFGTEGGPGLTGFSTLKENVKMLNELAAGAYNRLCGPALGDRAGAAAILAALARCDPAKIRKRVVVAFVAQRWFRGRGQAGRGAEALAERLKPAMLLAVGAAPGAKLGAGAAIPEAFAAARAAIPKEIPTQVGPVEDPGIKAFAGGNPTVAAIGIPVRNRFSPVEIVDGRDLEAAAQLVLRALEGVR
ncbi:MAG: amidohydrolase family protein [Planctomycetales bacterium]|nr:amidohydrolase family protein [Planctomycetales bacterium]